jgi:hypothetical protein
VSSSRLLTREGENDTIEDEDEMMTPIPNDENASFPEVEEASSEDDVGWHEDEKLLDETTKIAKQLRKESKTRIPNAGKQFKVRTIYNLLIDIM